jgi:hypothetical protein
MTFGGFPAPEVTRSLHELSPQGGAILRRDEEGGIRVAGWAT